MKSGPGQFVRATLLLVRLVAASRAVAETEFVRWSDTHFTRGTQRFYYVGTSCYYLGYFAQDTSPGPSGKTWREMADEFLERCRQMGLSVIRIWLFNERDGGEFGSHGEWRLRTAPGVYREEALVGFDYVLNRANRLGIFLVLTLVNNWDDYGGMQWYVDYSPTAQTHDDFYTDPTCCAWFKDHIFTMANRTNSFNGRIYKEDPTIFAWELANEPRCKSDPSGSTVQNWICEMASYVKSVDTNNMVTTGEEGWSANEWWEGTRWELNNACPATDYCVIHCWPDHWQYLWGDSEPDLYQSAMNWVRSHLADCETLFRKPFVLEEYGKIRPLEGAYGRNAYYQGWFDIVYGSAATNGAGAGLHFWMFEADNSGHDDGFSVFYTDASTVEMLYTHAWTMWRLTTPAITGISSDPSGSSMWWSEAVGQPAY
ncbi:MAG: glycoside hydrolase 5 family protein [Kiritimatiellia bacterium]